MLKNLVAVMMIGVFAVSVGCKKEGEDAKASRADQLVGTWEIDADAIIDAMVAKEKDEDKKKKMRSEASMVSAMQISFEFTDDGKATMSNSMFGKKDVKSGKYSVDSSDDDSVTVSIQDMGKNAPGKVRFRFMSNDQIKMEPVDEADKQKLGPFEMILKRAK